jgi:hypothetical protein
MWDQAADLALFRVGGDLSAGLGSAVWRSTAGTRMEKAAMSRFTHRLTEAGWGVNTDGVSSYGNDYLGTLS